MCRENANLPLPGTVVDGFTGIVWMPASASDRGHPSKPHISQAAALLVAHLDRFSDRERALRAHLARAKELWHSLLTDEDWLAFGETWPRWAIETIPLPALCPDGSLLTWTPTADWLVQRYGGELLSTLHGGEIAKVNVTARKTGPVLPVLRKFEFFRRAGDLEALRSVIADELQKGQEAIAAIAKLLSDKRLDLDIEYVPSSEFSPQRRDAKLKLRLARTHQTTVRIPIPSGDAEDWLMDALPPELYARDVSGVGADNEVLERVLWKAA
jgi:hypothetical protein